MDFQLEGKRALVTGSSRGLGRAMATSLAGEGVRVMVHGRNKVAAEEVAHSLSGSDRVAVVLGDLAADSGVDQVAAGAEAAFGGVDILVNNAGLFGPTDWNSVVIEDWLDLYHANAAAPARLSALLAPGMQSRGWGRLIHIGSLAAAVGLPMAPNYAASKAALVAISSSLAKHYGRYGITSNVLGVGVIANMAESVWLDGENPSADPTYEFMTSIPDGHHHINPMGRSGTPDEVAFMVTVLASPLSSYVNGTLVRVDGGCVPTLGF